MRISFSQQLLSFRDIVLDEKAFKDIPEKNHDKARLNAEEIEAIDFEHTVDGKRYNGFYARLKNLPKGERHPVIILNRGGAGLFGVIDARQIYSGFATAIIKAGYIVIGSQRMGFGEGGAPDELGGADLQATLSLKQLIHADDTADASRIGLYCASHGAITTFRLLAETDWVKAAVVISGSLDIRDDTFRPEMQEKYAEMFGGSVEERTRRSVLAWPEKLPKNVPILLMNGTADWRVDPRSAVRLSEKLIDLRVPHRLVMFEGGDHFLAEYWQESRTMAIAWLDRFVRQNGALPDLTPHGK